MLAAGVGLFSYPYISQYFFQKRANEAIEDFQNSTVEKFEEESGGGSSDDRLDDLYRRMEEYNENLFLTGQIGLADPFSYETPSFDLLEFGFAENIVGYIEIPKIDVRLPVYLGASEENMNKGAVHLSQTSLPIGGNNTNCVIAAHRGSTIGFMFRNIHKLEIGDEIYVANFRETLTYKVVETKIILPNEIDEVMIRAGKDMVTLSSCNPIGHNYERYIVFSERVES